MRSGQRDILQRRERGQQVVELGTQSPARCGGAGSGRYRPALHFHRPAESCPRSRVPSKPRCWEQGALARARRPHQRDEIRPGCTQIDAVQTPRPRWGGRPGCSVCARRRAINSGGTVRHPRCSSGASHADGLRGSMAAALAAGATGASTPHTEAISAICAVGAPATGWRKKRPPSELRTKWVNTQISATASSRPSTEPSAPPQAPAPENTSTWPRVAPMARRMPISRPLHHRHHQHAGMPSTTTTSTTPG